MPQGLFDRLQTTGKLPTPPGVVLELLELTRREDASVRQVADTLAKDPMLAAKILRFANSPMAGVPREVTSLQQAVAMMGIRGVQMMALSFSVLGAADGNTCRGFDQQQYGLQAVGCGVAARILASTLNLGSPQSAFLAGLLSQTGRAALASGAPDEYATILARAQQIPSQLPPLEAEMWGETYPSIGAKLLRSWGIPEALCAPIARFRTLGADKDEHPLARILRVAEVAAEIVCPDAKGNPPNAHAFVKAAEDSLGIEPDRCAIIISEISREIENTRTTLDMPKRTMRSPEDLELEVRERIAELGLAIHLENQCMAQQQEDLVRRATTDALTGVGNRVAFDARLSIELERSARSGSPFGLLMIDVDNFKAFNDTYGHQAGDRVLSIVAGVLDANIRKIDYLARYGGEEFTAITPDTSVDGIAILAERLRKAIEDTSVPWEQKELSVTISIGVAVYTEDVNTGDAHNIIKTADEQMYAAKRAGRNRVRTAVNDRKVERLATAPVT